VGGGGGGGGVCGLGGGGGGVFLFGCGCVGGGGGGVLLVGGGGAFLLCLRGERIQLPLHARERSPEEKSFFWTVKRVAAHGTAQEEELLRTLRENTRKGKGKRDQFRLTREGCGE